MRAYERMLNYIKIWTTSDSSSESVPSTSRQFDLARILVEEMKKLGMPMLMINVMFMGLYQQKKDMKTKQN